MRKTQLLFALILGLLIVSCGEVPSTEDAINDAAGEVEEAVEEVMDDDDSDDAEEMAEEEMAEEPEEDLPMPDEVTVAYFLEWPTPNQVAQLEQTYDDALGVPVNWVSFDTGVAMSAAMASGDVDIAYSQGLVPFC